jgi:hypothetical protein
MYVAPEISIFTELMNFVFVRLETFLLLLLLRDDRVLDEPSPLV